MCCREDCTRSHVCLVPGCGGPHSALHCTLHRSSPRTALPPTSWPTHNHTHIHRHTNPPTLAFPPAAPTLTCSGDPHSHSYPRLTPCPPLRQALCNLPCTRFHFGISTRLLNLPSALAQPSIIWPRSVLPSTPPNLSSPLFFPTSWSAHLAPYPTM